MRLVCGIDEAGRGPVIGPLVMAGVLIEEGEEEKLRNIGVKDSKMLTPDQRSSMFKQILASVREYRIISLTPDVIDENLKSDASNLNLLEARTTAQIINYLKPDKAILDLPDRNKERYLNYIVPLLDNKDITMIAEHKADQNYSVVSAASILAKVTRDMYIVHLHEAVGEDFGSGYTSDDKTIKFLQRNWDNQNIHFFRREWQSWKDLKAKKSQKKLLEY